MPAKSRAKRKLILAASTVAVTISLLVPGPLGPGPAGAGVEDEIDHFQCWEANFPDAEPARVDVNDFITDTRVKTRQPRLLCNPVEKEREVDGVTEIIHSNYHLVYYPVTPKEEAEITVKFECGQFACPFFLDLDGPSGMLVPTRKIPHDKPVGLNHYLCYRVVPGEGDNPQENGVKLRDQFRNRTTMVRWTKMACRPTMKQHGDKEFVINDDARLTCYKTTAFEFNENNRPEVNIRNQISHKDGGVVVKRARLLCAPTGAP